MLTLYGQQVCALTDQLAEGRGLRARPHVSATRCRATY